jgi:hypothetical protein
VAAHVRRLGGSITLGWREQFETVAGGRRTVELKVQRPAADVLAVLREHFVSGGPFGVTQDTEGVLEEQLRQEREAHAEARRLLAAALERIPPQLEAPTAPAEPRESPETPPDAGPNTEAFPETGRERRGFWSRLFGSGE